MPEAGHHFQRHPGSLWSLQKTQAQAKEVDQPWAFYYARAIQVSLVAYMAGAMFLNRAHFDLVYQLGAMAVAMPGLIAYELVRYKRKRRGPVAIEGVEVSSSDPFQRAPTG